MVKESGIRVIGLTVVIIAIFALSYLFYLKGEGIIPMILLCVGIILSFILGASALKCECNKR